MAYTHGWSNVQFELDTLTVIKALNRKNKSPFHWAFKIFFNDVCLYISNFANLNFVSVHKRANKLPTLCVSGRQPTMSMDLWIQVDCHPRLLIV